MLFVQILFVKSAFLSLTKHKICRAKLPETLFIILFFVVTKSRNVR